MGASPVDSWGALAAIIGGGGISGILIAVFGYLKAQREGRQGEPEKAGLHIGALLADSESVDKMAVAIDRGAKAMEANATAVGALALGMAEARPHILKKFEDLVGKLDEMIDEMRKARRATEDAAEAMRHMRSSRED